MNLAWHCYETNTTSHLRYFLGKGYASDEVNEWTPEILELKTKAEQWHYKHTGLKGTSSFVGSAMLIS